MRCTLGLALLNLPMDTSRGFRVPPRGGSRGLFQPRVGTGIATTPVAPDHHLLARFSRHHQEDGCGSIRGVDSEDHLPMHTRAALTASRSWYQGEEQCIQRG
jgi:hypothetical protein